MTKEHKKKDRCITATDSEWDRIQTAAKTLGISTSRFVIERSLARERQSSGADQQGSGANMNETIEAIFRDVRVLMKITEGKMEQNGTIEWLENIRRSVDKESEARQK